MSGLLVFFQLVGMLTIGALIGLITAPFIFYLMEIIDYALASIVDVRLLKKHTKEELRGFPRLKELPALMNKPIYHSNAKKAGVRYPKPKKDVRNLIVDRNIVSTSCEKTANTPRHADYCPTNENVFDMPQQQIIAKASNLTPNVIHRVLSFYRRFYASSTKVEKNLLTDYMCTTCGNILASSFSICSMGAR